MKKVTVALLVFKMAALKTVFERENYMEKSWVRLIFEDSGFI